GRILCRGPFRGGLLCGGLLLGRRRGAAIREELVRPRFGKGGHLIALTQGRVRRHVRHVGAEAGILDADWIARLPHVTELRERWARRHPAAPALGLRVDLEGLVQGDLEDLILRREGTGVRALSQVWPVPAVLGGDLYFFRVLALPLGDGADDPGQ